MGFCHVAAMLPCGDSPQRQWPVDSQSRTFVAESATVQPLLGAWPRAFARENEPPRTPVDSRRPSAPDKHLPFDSEPPSPGTADPTAIVSRIEALRAAGQSLDAVLHEARRFVLRTARLRRFSRSVLVVDDMDDFRALCLVELRALDFRTEEAVDGPDAIAQAIALRPDAIMMDFAMPDVDGGEVARRLSADERTRGIPVLLVSGYAERIPPDVRHGCAGFLSKPCDCEEVAALLHVIIDVHRGAPDDRAAASRAGMNAT
jgi:CheY-like chemotaxis protein